MPDRAEQIKALIAEAEEWDASLASRIPENAVAIIHELAAALTASETEVTRLETGIVEAHELIDTADESGLSVEAVVELCNVFTVLSHPTPVTAPHDHTDEDDTEMQPTTGTKG